MSNFPVTVGIFLLVACTGALAHKDGPGAHTAEKHDTTAYVVEQLLYSEGFPEPWKCSKEGVQASYMTALKQEWYVPELNHAWHIEWKKACRAAGYGKD